MEVTDSVSARLHAAVDRVVAVRAHPRRLLLAALISVGVVAAVALALQPGGSASPPGSGAPEATDVTAAGAASAGFGETGPRAGAPSHDAVGNPSETASDPTSGTTSSTVVVHVAGAVVRPGVVSLASTARVVDAIDAVGGPRADADPDQLDLAAHVTDGSRIYVPRRGEVVTPAAPSGPGAGSAVDGTPDPAGPNGPVHLNTATTAELEALPGIGPSLAQAIVAERSRLGGFRRIDDLRRVRGIGDRRFEQLRPLVAL